MVWKRRLIHSVVHLPSDLSLIARRAEWEAIILLPSILRTKGSCGENYSQMYALLKSGEISKGTIDEFDKQHYSVENKLVNLAKSLSKKLKTGQGWNSDYKTE